MRSRRLVAESCAAAAYHLGMPARHRDDAEWEAEEREFARLTASYNRHLRALEAAREALHARIVKNLESGPMGPSDLVRNTPFEMTHIHRLRREHGIEPKKRPGKKTAGEDASDS